MAVHFKDCYYAAIDDVYAVHAKK